MPHAADKQKAVYDFLLDVLENVYNEKQSPDIRRKKIEVFPTKDSLIKRVFSDGTFAPSDTFYSASYQPKSGQIAVSYSTARKAVNALIDDYRITKGPDGYMFVPQLSEELRKHPVLNIASSINIEVNAPESLIFLRVDAGMTELVAKYLTAQFYQGDILFIPLGSFIMCIGVYSSDALEEGLPGCVTPQILRGRIEAALCHFNLQYPEFRYGVYYELGFTSRYHKPTREDMERIIDQYCASSDPTIVGTEKLSRENLRHVIMTLFGNMLDLYNGDIQDANSVLHSGSINIHHEDISDNPQQIQVSEEEKQAFLQFASDFLFGE